ncbi:MAG: hypothetical protein ABSF77_12305 [Spirochaetia bacterium]|jgi:hypothetical protein
MAPVEGTTRVASAVKKKRPLSVFFAALIIILFYFLLFPYPLGKDLVARPVWAVPVPKTPVAAPAGAPGPAAPFQLGDTFGYVSAEGAVVYAARTLFRVALSDAGFVNYTRLGTDWIVQSPGGGRILSFSGNGYPLLSPEGDRIFNVKSDLSGLIELDSSGETLWSRDFPAMMTSISLHGDSLLVGLLNGTLVLLNRKGYPVLEYAPAGSRIPVIVGDAVSADGSLIASISGIDPQYLTVIRRRAAGQTALARLVLSSDFRREARMAFSPDARFLLFETEQGAGLFDPGSRRTSWVMLRGALSGMAFAAAGRYAALSAQDGARAELAIIDPFNRPLYRESFAARELTLGSVGNQILIAWEGWLLRVNVEEL